MMRPFGYVVLVISSIINFWHANVEVIAYISANETVWVETMNPSPRKLVQTQFELHLLNLFFIPQTIMPTWMSIFLFYIY